MCKKGRNDRSCYSVVTCLVLMAMVLSSIPTSATMPNGLFLNFYDVTYDLNIDNSRTPAIAELNDALYIAWASKVQNPNSKPVNGTSVESLLSKVIYVRTFNETRGVIELGTPILLTPNSNDTLGQGNNNPLLYPYKGKMYILWQSDDPAQKLDNTGYAMDILYKTTTGNGKWSSTLMASQETTYKGGDEFANAITFNDKMYLTWTRSKEATNSSLDSYSEIYIRSFDGVQWGSLIRVSEPSNNTINEFSKMCIFNGTIYIVWSSYVRGSNATRLEVRTFDGTNLGKVQIIATHDISIVNFKIQPTIESLGDDLWVVWRAVNEFSIRTGTFNDFDIVGRNLQNGKWSDLIELTDPLSKMDTLSPCLKSNGQVMVLTWISNDGSIKPGNDWDILGRTFDGEDWGEVYQVSYLGDRDRLDEEQEHNLGDDIEPTLGIYHHKIICVWQTFDDSIGRDGHRDLALKYITDYDNDNDGFLDSVDMFPFNKKEWLDSDKDGVGDNSDPRPLDPSIWSKEQVKNLEDTSPYSQSNIMIGIVFVVSIMIVMFVALFLSRKRSAKEMQNKQKNKVKSQNKKKKKS